MNEPPKAIRQHTVTEQIIEEVKQLIANGNYKYNDRIPTEHELAEMFSVSRSSVREAMKTLSYLGIMESQTSRGTRISNKNRLAREVATWSVLLSYRSVREAFLLGTALDIQSSIIAIESFQHNEALKEEMADRIDDILKRMTTAAVQDNYDEFRSAFCDFFDELYEISDNSIFISLQDCIDGLINDRICKAYQEEGAMLKTTMYLGHAWEAILNLSIHDMIDIFLDYGAFSFEVFSRHQDIIANEVPGSEEIPGEEE